MAAFDDDARRWARTTLGMSAGDDARFALLRKVKASGFNLPADVGVAFRVVSEPAGKLGDVGRILESAGFGFERDQQRRRAIDSFAGLFFSLPSAERAARFRALVAECGSDPLLESQLARLGPGLEIDLDRDGLTAQEERVVSIVRELFPLAPEEQAVRRRELVREVGRDRPFDVKTLDRLRMNWPALARLDPELWRKLESAVAGWQSRRTQPVIERAPAVAPAPTRSRPAPAPTTPAPQPGRNMWWPLIVIAILASTLGRACNSPPAHEQPMFRPAFQQGEADRKKQQELVDGILNRNREKKDADDANK